MAGVTWKEVDFGYGPLHQSSDGKWQINATTDPKVWMLLDVATHALHAQGSVNYLKHCAAYEPPAEEK